MAHLTILPFSSSYHEQDTAMRVVHTTRGCCATRPCSNSDSDIPGARTAVFTCSYTGDTLFVFKYGSVRVTYGVSTLAGNGTFREKRCQRQIDTFLLKHVLETRAPYEAVSLCNTTLQATPPVFTWQIVLRETPLLVSGAALYK